jgi:hypothetical protein
MLNVKFPAAKISKTDSHITSLRPGNEELLIRYVEAYHGQVHSACKGALNHTLHYAHAHAHAHAIFILTTTKPLPDLAANTDYVTLTLTAFTQ